MNLPRKPFKADYSLCATKVDCRVGQRHRPFSRILNREYRVVAEHATSA